MLSPRTANYVAALIQKGDKFDYYEWLQKVRVEEDQAKQDPGNVRLGQDYSSPN